jgi:hypothetical protein
MSNVEADLGSDSGDFDTDENGNNYGSDNDKQENDNGDGMLLIDIKDWNDSEDPGYWDNSANKVGLFHNYKYKYKYKC